MDISSGHEGGHGNSTASSGSNGSSDSSGSNFSTSTSTTTVPTFLYGNLRRFCGQKMDGEESKICPAQMFGPVAKCTSANDDTGILNLSMSGEIANDISHLRENKNTTLSKSIDCLNDLVQERKNSAICATDVAREERNSGINSSNNCIKTRSLNRHNAVANNGNILDVNRTSSVFTFDNISSIPPCSKKSKATFVNIQIKATVKTRVYVSSSTKSRSTLPNFNLSAELPYLQDHAQESEDEEKHENTDHCTQQNPEHTSKRSSQRQIRVGKTTTVLFAVTLAYILSFLPYLTVMVMRSVIKDLEEHLSPVGELAYKLCVKSFFINNAINPIIYSFLNQAFRQDAKQMLSGMCSMSKSSSHVGRTIHHGDAV